MPGLAPTTRTALLPSVASSVGAARRLVADALTAAGIDVDVIDTALLLTSEVVTNAVLHARTDVNLTVHADSGVRVEVSDRSAALPRPRRHAAESITGRGLDLVEALATSHGVSPAVDGAGKTVWFTLGSPDTTESKLPTPENDTAFPAPAAAVHVGVLAGLPVGLYRVLQQHNEALLREYEVHCLSQPTFGQSQGQQVADAAHARAALSASALTAAEGLPDHAHVDALIFAQDADLPGFADLPPVFAAADQLAASGVLLIRPALPELIALRTWVFGQLIAQLNGDASTRWVAPLNPGDPLVAQLTVDTDWVSTEPRAVVLADDTNRILAVSAAAAALLRRSEDDLRGQRLTSLVPPDLKEAHVAGFTRHLLTGHATILGRQVTVPAQLGDGTTHPISLLLEQRPAGHRTYYVAWLDTAGD